MDDKKTHDARRTLFELANEQLGYFTTAQAEARGVSRRQLTYFAHDGRIQRFYPGLYRLRDFPASPHEDVAAAWVAAGPAEAVASHETALSLLGLGLVIPDAVHLTIPRSRRYRRTRPGVKIHTTVSPLTSTDVVVREGIRATSPIRTILDAAERGTAPEQIEMAVRQAVEEGLLTPSRLLSATEQRPVRVRRLIEKALSEGST